MSTSQSEPVTRQAFVYKLGTVSYDEGYKAQEDFHRKVKAGELPGAVLILEHNPVLTLGKHADLSYVLIDENERLTRGVDYVRTDRGGEVTAHMPGQLVVYPILPVLALGLGARDYVNALMQAVIQTLVHFGVKARCDAEFPGVWVGANKICAVGVRIRERVSLHGIALNVNNSLELFESIVPCGIRHLGVTSLVKELGQDVTVETVETVLRQALSETLGLSLQAAKNF
ncbi:MAG: lipoyl(octanoyl) transferase LipB [Bdellovibrionota bacterium]